MKQEGAVSNTDCIVGAKGPSAFLRSDGSSAVVYILIGSITVNSDSKRRKPDDILKGVRIDTVHHLTADK